jgi:hypothetical protein
MLGWVGLNAHKAISQINFVSLNKQYIWFILLAFLKVLKKVDKFGLFGEKNFIWFIWFKSALLHF